MLISNLTLGIHTHAGSWGPRMRPTSRRNPGGGTARVPVEDLAGAASVLYVRPGGWPGEQGIAELEADCTGRARRRPECGIPPAGDQLRRHP